MTAAPIGPVEITISTNLLEAVAKWALHKHGEVAGDYRSHLSQVVFRDDEVFAVDGHRLVRVPLKTHGLTFGLRRCDALAVVAMARAQGGKMIRIRKPSDGVIDLRVSDADRPVIRVVEVTDGTPPIEELFDAMATRDPAPAPDGIALDHRYLADIREVVQALDASRGVIVTRWGGMLDPVLFEGPAGSRFVIMPMRAP